MRKITGLLIFIWVLFGTGCNDDSVSAPGSLDKQLETLIKTADPDGLSGLQFPASTDFNQIPQDPLNPITTEKVQLGKLLYHETALGRRAKYAEGLNTYSCASCHHVAAGFQAGKQQGIGDGGIGFGNRGEARDRNPNYPIDSLDVQPIRSPTALNVAYQTNMLWNGQFGATGVNTGTEDRWPDGTPIAVNRLGYEGVETQAIAGMTVHRQMVDTTYLFPMGYQSLFDQAFPDFPRSKRYTNETAGLAMAAYERTLLAQEAPFQKWLGGDYSAMSDQQKRGAILFFGTANCVSCHNGPALSSMEFHALGMEDLNGPGVYGPAGNDPAKLGRGSFTKNSADNYKFKVPQLYNLKDSPFYGHGGTFHSIKEVVMYKNMAVKSSQEVPDGQLASEFQPLGLSEAQVEAISSFLAEGLYDAALTRYVPNSLPSALCFPNNDSMSKEDLNCN